MNQQPRHIYEFGAFRLNAAEHILLRDGEAVPLTPKAFDLPLNRTTQDWDSGSVPRPVGSD
jgi:DNA-binding response OmpR family regulator